MSTSGTSFLINCNRFMFSVTAKKQEIDTTPVPYLIFDLGRKLSLNIM